MFEASADVESWIQENARTHWIKDVGERAGYAGVGHVKELTPYGGALLCEAYAVEGTQHWLKPSDFDALSDRTLELVLRTHGLSVERARFERRAGEIRSAWTLARALWPQTFISGTPAQQDFAGLAAASLWRRWLPNQPCAEAIGWTLRAIDPHLLDEPPTPHSLLTAWETAWAILDALLPPGKVPLATAQRFNGARLPLEDWLTECAMTFASNPAGEDPALLTRAADVLEAALRRVDLPREISEPLTSALADLRLAVSDTSEPAGHHQSSHPRRAVWASRRQRTLTSVAPRSVRRSPLRSRAESSGTGD